MCNLYPFVKTVSKQECSLQDAVEEIDIGMTFVFLNVVCLFVAVDIFEHFNINSAIQGLK